MAESTGGQDALRSEIHAFYTDWFGAIKRHDRAWVESHLSPEMSDWIVPSGKALLREDFLDVEMSMEGFDAEIVELHVEETGGFIVALSTMALREDFPDPSDVDDRTRSTMEEAGVYGVVTDTWSTTQHTVINTILRRDKADGGRLLVVHHMLVGLAQTAV